MLSQQSVNIERGAALRQARSFYRKPIDEVKWNREWGILQSASERWKAMGSYHDGELVEEGYVRLVPTGGRRYATTVKTTAYNRLTGETFDRYITVNHERLMKAGTIKDRSIQGIPSSALEYLEIIEQQIVAGYRRL